MVRFSQPPAYATVPRAASARVLFTYSAPNSPGAYRVTAPMMSLHRTKHDPPRSSERPTYRMTRSANHYAGECYTAPTDSNICPASRHDFDRDRVVDQVQRGHVSNPARRQSSLLSVDVEEGSC